MPLQRRQNSIAAAYYRGGTSRAIMIQVKDLPTDKAQWDPIFLGAIGSPDPYGRQLDGLGGGISSLSKICVVGPSTHPDADVDYTFVSLGIKNTHVDYSSNCGNMTAAVGPFAVDSGLLSVTEAEGETTTVRIHNTNTKKIIHARFPMADGEAASSGDLAIDGVAGTAAPIELRFIDPAGSRTGKLLPTGNPIDVFDGVRTTCIDAGNPCCFVQAAELDVDGSLTPKQIDDHPNLKDRLESIRGQAAVKMGLADSLSSVPGSVPKIAIVSRPSASSSAKVVNLVARAMSVGQPHKAIPVTVALALAAGAKTPGTTVAECVIQSDGDGDGSALVVQHASGTLTVDADFDGDGDLKSANVYRTARRLMEGKVFWK
ncbi:unnamed protein product [Clonostachys rosea f. rosea IK726]|uniref:Uncharacterized protein n=1 Tax=Clonostachys rosea f. rosea IK726 TaxID=1349383 RepID=A0ACA9UJB7_BIOOC|nr:unnamed protein product [Clonostachys rosea f. rosea IK726]